MPGGVELLKEHKVVIVEGNYMLNYDDPLWSPLKELFDEKVLLTGNYYASLLLGCFNCCSQNLIPEVSP